MSAYQAIVNLSVPRVGDPNRETDLVLAGETIDLTDDMAAKFLPPLKAFPMIRSVRDSSDPLPAIHPKQLSGIAINQRTGKRIGVPGPPQDARPDPPGSTTITVLEEPPEANEPQPGSEDASPDQDAVDIPPRAARARPAPARRGS
jgi:hypothetical protein